MHACHAYDCPTVTKPEMFMCRKHWYVLSPQLRSQIWRAYRPGQCDDWQISERYAGLAKHAVRFVAEKENKTIPVGHACLGVYDYLSRKDSPAYP